MQFIENSKKHKIMSDEEVKQILNDATSGVLCLQGEEYPYGVPISFYYDGKDLVFHSRGHGHKYDVIKSNNKACFTIIYKDTLKPELRTTNYKSIIVFGDIREVTEIQEKKECLLGFCNKYAKGFEKTNIECTEKNIANVTMLKMSMLYVSGKFQERTQ